VLLFAIKPVRLALRAWRDTGAMALFARDDMASSWRYL